MRIARTISMGFVALVIAAVISGCSGGAGLSGDWRFTMVSEDQKKPTTGDMSLVQDEQRNLTGSLTLSPPNEDTQSSSLSGTVTEEGDRFSLSTGIDGFSLNGQVSEDRARISGSVTSPDGDEETRFQATRAKSSTGAGNTTLTDSEREKVRAVVADYFEATSFEGSDDGSELRSRVEPVVVAPTYWASPEAEFVQRSVENLNSGEEISNKYELEGFNNLGVHQGAVVGEARVGNQYTHNDGEKGKNQLRIPLTLVRWDGGWKVLWGGNFLNTGYSGTWDVEIGNYEPPDDSSDIPADVSIPIGLPPSAQFEMTLDKPSLDPETVGYDIGGEVTYPGGDVVEVSGYYGSEWPTVSVPPPPESDLFGEFKINSLYPLDGNEMQGLIPIPVTAGGHEGDTFGVDATRASSKGS